MPVWSWMELQDSLFKVELLANQIPVSQSKISFRTRRAPKVLFNLTPDFPFGNISQNRRLFKTCTPVAWLVAMAAKASPEAASSRSLMQEPAPAGETVRGGVPAYS